MGHTQGSLPPAIVDTGQRTSENAVKAKFAEARLEEVRLTLMKFSEVVSVAGRNRS
jgi:hypothetical protein